MHHLIPRSVRGIGYVPKCGESVTIAVCRRCHVLVHQKYSHKELASEFNNGVALRAAPKLQNHIKKVQELRIKALDRAGMTEKIGFGKSKLKRRIWVRDVLKAPLIEFIKE